MAPCPPLPPPWAPFASTVIDVSPGGIVNDWIAPV